MFVRDGGSDLFCARNPFTSRMLIIVVQADISSKHLF